MSGAQLPSGQNRSGILQFNNKSTKNRQKINAKQERKNDKDKLQKISILIRFWERFWEVLGRFGRYKSKVKRKLFFMSTRGMICLHLGGGWDAKMQPCLPKLRQNFLG